MRLRESGVNASRCPCCSHTARCTTSLLYSQCDNYVMHYCRAQLQRYAGPHCIDLSLVITLHSSHRSLLTFTKELLEMARRLTLVSDVLLSVGLGLLALNIVFAAPRKVLADGESLAGNCINCKTGCRYSPVTAICAPPAGAVACPAQLGCDGTCTCKVTNSFQCPCN